MKNPFNFKYTRTKGNTDSVLLMGMLNNKRIQLFYIYISQLHINGHIECNGLAHLITNTMVHTLKKPPVNRGNYSFLLF